MPLTAILPENKDDLLAHLARRFYLIADAFERGDVAGAQMLLALTQIETASLDADADDDADAVPPGRN